MSLEDLVALNATGMVGTVLHQRLLSRFGSPGAALRAPLPQLLEVPGIGPITAQAIVQSRDRGRWEFRRAASTGVQILGHDDPHYPAALRQIFDHPLVIYVQGTLTPSDALAVGIVGSRGASTYGLRQAFRFGSGLADLGVTVVSGLARGVDTQAHRGALSTREGRTLAVLGSGLSRIYPPENAPLAADIARRGALISEFPIDAQARPENFPRRNRIIAGLSMAILVAEARLASGALITADWALEAGREVLVIPGPVDLPHNSGGHALLREGARVVVDIPDVLEDLPLLAARQTTPTLSPLERAVLRAVGPQERSDEDIQRRCRLPSGIVGRILAELARRCLIESSEAGWRRARVEDQSQLEAKG